MPPPAEGITKVVVHPLVLLSVVDHFNRVSTAGSQRRVVGVLLGANRKGILDVSNSFAGNGRVFVILNKVVFQRLNECNGS